MAEFRQRGQDITVEVTRDFDLFKIFDCGQAFRFRRQGSEVIGVAFGRVLRMSQEGQLLTIYDCTAAEYLGGIEQYLSLDMDYGEILEQLDTDAVMSAAIGAGRGIRILKQELWEMLITFIISQNNNIPRITKLVEALCVHYGKPLSYNGEILYTFPDPFALSRATEAELTELKFGYRAGYIVGFVQSVLDGGFELSRLSQLDTPEARKYLLGVKGIGGKVADCILLFGMARYEVCPHDVWVKRIFSERYNIDDVSEKKGYALATAKWGKYAGIAQQLLFYAERYEGALQAAAQ